MAKERVNDNNNNNKTSMFERYLCVCVAVKVSKLPRRLNEMVDVKLSVPTS